MLFPSNQVTVLLSNMLAQPLGSLFVLSWDIMSGQIVLGQAFMQFDWFPDVIISSDIQYDTFTKWKHDLDKEFNTVTWLKCETVMEGIALHE